MSDFEFVRAQLQSKAQSLYAVARGSGVPFSTVQRIASGQTPAPRVDTVEKLARYFRDQAIA
jgi:transcriptional regulator with XRE-family HTH domain